MPLSRSICLDRCLLCPAPVSHPGEPAVLMHACCCQRRLFLHNAKFNAQGTLTSAYYVHHCKIVQSLQNRCWLCCCRRNMTQKVICGLRVTCSMHLLSMMHVCHAPCRCVIFIIVTGTQLQLVVWNLLGGSFHVIVLLHHRLCWLSECWQAARYVHTEAHI